jgi:hypothetical protein
VDIPWRARKKKLAADKRKMGKGMKYFQSIGGGEIFYKKHQLARGGAGGGGRMGSGDSEILPAVHCLPHRGETGWSQVLPRKPGPVKEEERSVRDGIFFRTKRTSFDEWGTASAEIFLGGGDECGRGLGGFRWQASPVE